MKNYITESLQRQHQGKKRIECNQNGGDLIVLVILEVSFANRLCPSVEKRCC